MKTHRPHRQKREPVMGTRAWSRWRTLTGIAVGLACLVLLSPDLQAHDLTAPGFGRSDPGNVPVPSRNKGPRASASSTQAVLGATLTLKNKIVNNDGGTAHVSAWTISATGPTPFSGSRSSVFSPFDFAPGTYHLSASDGPAGYVASSWICTGAKQLDRDSVSIKPAEHAECTITHNDVAADFRINPGHSGAWYFPDTSGQGQFIAVDPANGFLFLGWFTYTQEGSDPPHEQHWLTAEGFLTGNIAELTVYQSSGGELGGPKEVATVLVGDALVEFHDCDNATMRYRLDPWELAGEFPLTRVIPGSGKVCAEHAVDDPPPTDLAVGGDGAWYDPATPGQGFFIDVHDRDANTDFVFLSWFTYGDTTSSGRRWLTAEGTLQGSTAELVVYDTNGGSFDDPAPTESVVAGSMTLDFADCKSAMLTYSLPDEALHGAIPITRIVPMGEAACESVRKAR